MRKKTQEEKIQKHRERGGGTSCSGSFKSKDRDTFTHETRGPELWSAFGITTREEMGSIHTHLEPPERPRQNVPVQAPPPPAPLTAELPETNAGWRSSCVKHGSLSLMTFGRGKTLLTHLLTHSTCLGSKGTMGQRHVPGM